MTTIKLNSKGDDVKKLQEYLVKLGYHLTPDGDFGYRTHAAVIHFQLTHGLAADGVVGPVTWQFINAGVAEHIIEGIDVSYWNGNINWDKVAKTHIKFAICKATEGQNIADARFASYFSELKRVGMIRGAYHFYRFFTPPAQQLENFLAHGPDYSQPGVLPPFVDVEYQDSHGTTNSTISTNAKKYTDELHQFITTLETRTGRTPIIYTQKSFWDGVLLKPTGFEKYPLWAVDYNNKTTPLLAHGFPAWKFWQYKDSGSIDGINGKVDSNKFNGTVEELKVLSNLINW